MRAMTSLEIPSCLLGQRRGTCDAVHRRIMVPTDSAVEGVTQPGPDGDRSDDGSGSRLTNETEVDRHRGAAVPSRRAAAWSPLARRSHGPRKLRSRHPPRRDRAHLAASRMVKGRHKGKPNALVMAQKERETGPPPAGTIKTLNRRAGRQKLECATTSEPASGGIHGAHPGESAAD